METQVLIAGAGPTGLMLAHELALAGVETLVVERLAHRIEQVKGGVIQPRTAELLDLRGLLDPMLARALPREPVGGHFAMLDVPLDCTPWNTRHPYPIALPQWEIEEVLEQRGGARVLRETPVTAVEQRKDGVCVTAGEHLISARYLVACDGARSTVRKLLDVPFPGRPGTYVAVLADITLTSVSELVPERVSHISKLVSEGGGYWSMLVPVGADRYRFTFGRDAVARDVPVTGEEVAKALTAVYGERTVLGEVLNASRFTDATRQVESYRHGDVLFAGDAAHIHPPLGGQGLNLGVQDAFNLGWKLAATIHGTAPEGLLDTYQAERHPVGAQVLHHTAAQRVLANPGAGEDVVALRDIFTDLMRLPDANRHLAGLMSGLSIAYDLPGDHPLIGHRVPDVDLVTDTGQARLSALFGEGRHVTLDTTGEIPGAIRIEPVPELPAALTIRPDGYVSWVSGTQLAGFPDLR